MLKEISGGVCAPKGFKAAGVYCGVKSGHADAPQTILPSARGKNDLAMILSECECSAAAVYTLNRVKAAPIYVTMGNLEDGVCRGIVANSGNANACAPMSHENAEAMCQLAAQATGLKPEDFAVASTGVIGQTLNIAAIEKGMPGLVSALSTEGSDAAASAIMTTDTMKKETAVSVTIGGQRVTIGAIAKGSGMIHPNMGTMLCFITTDCAITSDMLADALHEIVPRTFNRVTIDGDTSTNDMCVVLANGMAENPLIEWKDDSYTVFFKTLHHVFEQLARNIAADGEGASKLVTVNVTGAVNDEEADIAARAVANSPLVKTCIAGHDCNWGRVAMALGKCGVRFDQEDVSIDMMGMPVCRDGLTVPFDEDEALRRFEAPEIVISADLGAGDAATTVWTCDLTHEYISINGDYRS